VVVCGLVSHAREWGTADPVNRQEKGTADPVNRQEKGTADPINRHPWTQTSSRQARLVIRWPRKTARVCLAPRKLEGFKTPAIPAEF